MRLIVVRHGTAKAKGSWKGSDDDRPLTTTGLEQAEAISRRLHRYRPARIVSSPSLRCRQTIEPLATTSGVQIELTKALATDGGRAGIDLALEVVASNVSTAVLCTHRELIVDILPKLAHQHGVSISHRLPGAKGGSWTLLYRRGRLVSIKYQPSRRVRRNSS